MVSGGHNKKATSNPYWSGRYLIYAIKHTINRVDDEYHITIKAVKDNVNHPYVAEHNSWTHVAPRRKTLNIYDIDKELLGRIQTSGELDGKKLPSRGHHG